MPLPTPFHPRTSALCTSLRWKDWAGYHAVCSYDTYHEREYFALRHAAGLIDVTPLFKYDVSGPGAGALLDRVMVKDVTRLEDGQVTYCCWCDERGKLLDDGTVWKFDERTWRVTSAEPNLAWLRRHALDLDVTVTDVTDRIAACSLQGPMARDVLASVAGEDARALRFFRLMPARIAGAEAIITRTGYTGDLGYEIWIGNDQAGSTWDAVLEAGRPYGAMPAGLDAMDMTRVEAGFILNGVDYFPAHRCLIDARTSTPDEAGLGWTVRLDRAPFVGQAALRAERAAGPRRAFVGLEVDWDALEALYARHGLPPEVCASAWRDARPVYSAAGRQIGQATSGSWSPMLKQNLALATVESRFEAVGTELRLEVTVEYERHPVRAIVRPRPFFDPPRKRA